MAFFKFRLPGQTAGDNAGGVGNAPTESVEAMRRRARHRLIGASVLVALGVLGFPLLFDTQPRPVSSDIAVDIPDRASSKPLAAPAAAASTSLAASLDPREEIVPPSSKDSKGVATSSVAQVVESDKPKAAKPESKPEAKSDAKTDVKPEAKPAAKAVAKADDKAEHKDGKDSKDAATRFVVQVGAFTDEGKVHEVRAKLDKAGLKSYTNVAETKDGKRTRVRVGPFTSRDDADKAAHKIKQLQLQPQVLGL